MDGFQLSVIEIVADGGRDVVLKLRGYQCDVPRPSCRTVFASDFDVEAGSRGLTSFLPLMLVLWPRLWRQNESQSSLWLCSEAHGLVQVVLPFRMHTNTRSFPVYNAFLAGVPQVNHSPS